MLLLLLRRVVVDQSVNLQVSYIHKVDRKE